MSFISRRAIFLFCLLSCGTPSVGAEDLPRSLDSRLEIVRFAGSPDIVHPISLDFDRRGRLLVIESHTHFRPAGYQGPENDRIRVVEDTNGDGKADRFTTFFEGTKATMDLAVHRDGSVYLATRNEVLRLRDTNDDGVADDRERILFLDTAGNYPHNGLSGLTFDADGNLYFGMGENLGATYKLIGADGVTISDEGEGGNVFWCTRDGKQLRRVATGFWNPFGLNFDIYGRLWCVDNDPDAAPPCRLLHVIEGGDYGYQFRYGRSGRHPFQSWNGQLAGTLPMVSGTGEAPCEVLNYQASGLPAEYRGELFVTSWADHRVERYALRPRGASYVADRKPFIQGGNDFRPVGLAVAPDGSLFISDWVRRDYNLHGQGGIWWIRPRKGEKTILEAKTQPPIALSPAYEAIAKLNDPRQLAQWLDHDDPFLRTAAAQRLIRSPDWVDQLRQAGDLKPRQRIGVLLAERALGRHDTGGIRRWLQDEDEEVRFLAVKWIADRQLKELRGPIAEGLEKGDLNVRMYQAYATALARIDGQEVSDAKMADHFVKLLSDDKTPSSRRIAALRLVPAAHKQLSLDLLDRLIASSDPALKREAVRTLAEHPDSRKFDRLKRLASDSAYDVNVRAEAVVGLSAATVTFEELVNLAMEESPVLRAEALRALSGAELSPAQIQRLQTFKPANASEAALLERVRGGSPVAGRPALNQTADWLARLSGPADPAAGQHIFFHSKLAGCYRCHRVQGHGADVGPDLGLIGRTERRHVIESILQPSTLVAPHYQVWQLVMNDGRTLTGMLLRTNLDEYTYIDPQGNTFKVRTIDIEESIPSPLSIMPNNLIDKLTDQEIRDLLAFLGTLK